MRVLVVGIATQDIVNTVATYPVENEEVRAKARRITLGGNASNTATVLAQLGHQVDLAAVLADDSAGVWIQQELQRRGVGHTYCVTHSGGHTPTSYITLSQDSGARTIVHHRDLREFSLQDFRKIPLDQFDWVHFEGRNTQVLEAMFSRLSEQPGIRTSLEVEKPRDGIEMLFGYPPVLIFSRSYVLQKGFEDAPAFMEMIPFTNTEIYCAWGESGGWMRNPAGDVERSPAFPPPQVIDTLGAGDVFNAALIDARLKGASEAQALEAACRLAGKKCGIDGLVDLV